MKKRQSGFTIVELIIYSGILVIFLYIMTSAFVAVIDAHLSSQATSAVVVDSRFLFSRFAYDIGRAEAIVTPEALGGQSSTLVLQIAGVPYIYALAGGSLQLTDGVGAGALNSAETTVSGLSFRRYGNVNGKHSVRIAFTLTSVTTQAKGPETRNFQTTIGLR